MHNEVISTDIDGCEHKMHLISFKTLFEMFTKSLHVEEKMLLFYMMLAENESFRVYVLSRTDQEIIASIDYCWFVKYILIFFIVLTHLEIDL